MKHKQPIAIATSLLTLSLLGSLMTGCNSAVALQTGEISDITKGYFPGMGASSSVTIDLNDYVDANGTEVTFEAHSDNTDIATVAVEGSTLTATLQGSEGNTYITATVNSNGKKAFYLTFVLTATCYERVACIGDSLTYGHAWHNESYPVYLQEILGDGVEVRNFGVNGSAVTDRSESSFKLKYDTLQEYRDSLAFAPDIAVIMLGTNDGYNWAGSAEKYEGEFGTLIQSYRMNEAKQIVILTSPPTLEKNAFNLPNDVIKEQVCPIQRFIADAFCLPLVDLRVAFEELTDMVPLYRPGDGVHFSVEGAKFVAERVAECLIEL